MQISYSEAGSIHWTPELESYLELQVRLKKSISDIALLFGTTRSAIAGRVHRLKVPTALVEIKPEPELDFTHTDGPVPRNLTLMEVGPYECRFIPDENLYCGHPVEEGKQYCPYHCGVVYVRR
jgi:hypothetical protein